MIKELSVSNARIFGGPKTWVFPFSDLSIFCGTNSAGKSTILKTLLLLQQNSARLGEERRTTGVLQFSGKSVDLGDYQSFISNNDSTKPLKISIVIEHFFPRLKLETLEKWCDPDIFELIKPVYSEKEKNRYQLKADFVFVPSTFFSDFLALEQPNEGAVNADSMLTGVVADQSIARGMLQSCSFDVSVSGVSVLKWQIEGKVAAEKSDRKAEKTTAKDLEIEYFLSFPLKFFKAFDGDRMLVADLNRINEKGYINFKAVMTGLFPIAILGEMPSAATPKERARKGGGGMRISTAYLPPIIDNALDDLRRDLQSVIYVGPLRSPGRRYYVLSQDAGTDFDAAGEFLPYILRDRRDAAVTYCKPITFQTMSQGNLEDALNEWMHFLKTGMVLKSGDKKEISPSFHRSYFGELKIKGRDNQSHSLADTGFGYSQVLPILVRGLLAREGSLLIVEQPELHLHPALQIRLAHFFLAMTYAKRQVLLETHSEHIVNSLRTLAAENPDTDISERLKIFFIDGEKSPPRVHDLSVLPNGTVPAWPQEFFGEGITLSGRLLRAQRLRIKAAQALEEKKEKL